MALADPQTLDFTGTPIVLPRTASGVNTGGFTAADGTAKLEVLHQYGKRSRRRARIEHSKIAPDPLLSANTRYSMSAYFVMDTPNVGYTLSEAAEVAAALVAWLTPENVQKLLGGES